MPTLNWIGKEQIINHHNDVPFRVLERKYTFGDYRDAARHVPTDTPNNKIIHGDNLEALKALLPEYEGRIKCIYIDPPYNTGNENWVYNDNVNSPKIRKWLGQVVGKESEDLSRHDKWLCMMYPRLVLLQKLLRDDGAIFISIDDNEQANLKLICDEIFGAGNFVANILWQKRGSRSNDANYFCDNHDFVIVYTKNKTQWNLNKIVREEEIPKGYSNPDNDPRGLWTSTSISAPTESKNGNYPIVSPSGKTFYPPSGRHWSFSKENYEALVADGRIYFGNDGNNVPRKKTFLSETQGGLVPFTIWMRTEVGDTQDSKREIIKIFEKNIFDTPKPTRLINRILQIASDKSSIILDSFAGSGTTAHAVLNLNKADGGNRKFILVEMEDYAETITAERVRRVIDGYGDTEGTGGSFDFYELGEPIFVADGNLNETIATEKIREYIWYSETRMAYCRDAARHVPTVAVESPYLLGNHLGTAYYFYYEKDQITTLDKAFLNTITQRAEQYVIYADNCLLSAEFMQANHIIFKKIPRDIKKL